MREKERVIHGLEVGGGEQKRRENIYVGLNWIKSSHCCRTAKLCMLQTLQTVQTEAYPFGDKQPPQCIHIIISFTANAIIATIEAMIRIDVNDPSS